MSNWVPKLVLRKTFIHSDGRKVLAYEDEGGWIVEARPAESGAVRPRWYPKTEVEAADTCMWLMKDEPGWSLD